ncbi:hypothetical protein HYW74_04835 [Candidatus Pacearchaeota archaeon]|nr:hypothetical protein [Candidatus Pacearchaeota archaeon]
MAKRGKVKRKLSRRNFIKPIKAPLSTKIVAVFFYIIAILTLLFGLIVIIGGLFGVALFSAVDSEKLAELIPSISLWNDLINQGLFTAILLSGAGIFIWGIIQFLIANGLLKGRKLAYLAAVIIIFIGFILSLSLVITLDWSALAGFVIYGILGYLLLFDKKSRKFFETSLLFKKRRR